MPKPSRTTIYPGISSLEIVANFALLIVASVISASTISDVDILPDASLCKIPGEVNEVI